MSKIPKTSVQLQQMIIDEMKRMGGYPPDLKMWVEPSGQSWRAKATLSPAMKDDDSIKRINEIADQLRRKYDLLD
jgi:hypothetical protein